MQPEIEKGKFVEFVMPYPYGGMRIGRLAKIKGSMLTVVLCPYGLRGERRGKRLRIPIGNLTGVLYRRKVIEIERKAKT